MALDLDYYYGEEAEQYTFYRIPKILFTDECFRSVSVEAKLLYGLLLDRMALSVKNGWLDREGRVYIIYTICDIMETLCCAEQKANKLLNELDACKGIGLIEKKRQGLGKPNIIYVKKFFRKPEKKEAERRQTQNGGKSQIKTCENHNSGVVKITGQEMRKSQTNKTDQNKTDHSETILSVYPVPEQDAGADGLEACMESVKENIDYDRLLEDYPCCRERIDGIVDIMAETLCTSQETVRIGQDDFPAGLVKKRLRLLNQFHIGYVLDCLDRSTEKVHNVRAYLLTALYRAPSTMEQYFDSLVRHDMAERFRGG